MSKINEIADAIVSELDAGSFSQTVDAERSYRVDFTLQDVEVLKVVVVPRKVMINPGNRKNNFHDYVIDIGILKKLEGEDEVDIDPFMDLVEEIVDFLRFRKLTGQTNVAWLKAENDPIYSVDHLHEMRQFTSLVSVTYRSLR